MPSNQDSQPHMTIRPMTKDDLTAVLEIEQVAKPTPWTETMYVQEFGNSHSQQYVYSIEEKIVGYIVWWLVVDEVQIQTIAVDLAWRGQKIGQQLLHCALQESHQKGAQCSVLEVRESNHPAQGLYRKYGYDVVGKRKKYYRDGETALIMTLDFTAVVPSFAEELTSLAHHFA